MQDSSLKRFIRDPAQLPEQINGDFPRVVAVDENDGAVTLRLEVTPDLSWFHGHFPGEPVLAGIIQTHWAVPSEYCCPTPVPMPAPATEEAAPPAIEEVTPAAPAAAEAPTEVVEEAAP